MSKLATIARIAINLRVQLVQRRVQLEFNARADGSVYIAAHPPLLKLVLTHLPVGFKAEHEISCLEILRIPEPGLVRTSSKYELIECSTTGIIVIVS